MSEKREKRPRMRRPAPVADLLRAILKGTPAEKRLKEGEIWLVWEDAVGTRIAGHAQPAAFRDGTLTLNVDSAPWMQQLNYLKRDLIAKVNEQLGQDLVKELYFKSGRVEKPSAPQQPHTPKRRPLTEEEKSWIAEQAAQCSDPELQSVFERLMQRDREARD